MNTSWCIGDVGYYVLRENRYRPTVLYLSVRILNVTPKRVVVRQVNGNQHHRVIKASKLVKQAPEGAWVM